MLNIMHPAPGRRLELRRGAIGEIVENMGDGIWVQLRILSAPRGDFAAGDEELIHCEDIKDLAPD